MTSKRFRMKRSLITLAFLAALPFAASAADGLSYNYVEGGYAKTDSTLDADGWALNGSVAFHPNFHLFGGYSSQEFDNTNFDFKQYRFGVGYNHPIASQSTSGSAGRQK